MKCEMKISKSHILYYKRSERKTYLQNLKAHDILKQIQMLQSIFDSCINLLFVACGSINGSQQNQRRTQIFIQNKDQSYKEFTESKLVQYLTLNFYSKLLTLFSCQYLLIHRFIQIMLHIAKASSQIMTFEVKQFKKFIYQFKTNCQNMIFMAEVNRNKKGFEQIQTKEFSTFSDDHILKVIDEYIDHHQNDQNLKQAHSKFQTLINVNKYGRNILKQIMVDKKPLKFDKNFRMTNSPRLPKKIEIKNEQITAFSSYFNNYSVSFPHKNMMSIDLIEDIRGLERRRRRSSYLRKQAAQQFPVQVNLLKKLNQERSTLEWGDIIVLTNDKDQEVQTRGSSKQLENRESFGSLDDLFHNKWIFSKTTTNIN